ncbi:Zinc fingerC2H2 type family protein, partial [Aphelenchoides avenae]
MRQVLEELRLSHHDEIDEELRSEIVVKGGIVMRVEKQGSVEPPTFITAHEVEPERHQIPLPGVAEEIESYPCPFCTDRVFLTAFGLEKHALERHNDQMGIVNHRIQQISEEWERRRTHDARRAQQIGIIRHQGESTSRGGNYANSKRMMTSHQSKFGICKICAIVINVSNPMAMENHMKVHEKNDELRQRLLQDYGPIVVAKLTCKECNLVFMDEEKLQAHYIAAHPRRR